MFVEEQNVPLELELDEHDRTDARARHALIRVRGFPVATGRFFELDARTAQIGRMAVLEEWRKRGLGARLLGALVDEARARGYALARLDAQTHAVEFYRRAGFAEAGEPLWDAGILHQPMSRALIPGKT